ncbi:MAG: hypothetical protein ACP5FK_09910 [bacterium]
MCNQIMDKIIVIFLIVLLASINSGCGFLGCGKLSTDDLPRYPNATEVETMEQSSPGGVIGGNMVQFTTEDSYDQVLEFYSDTLKSFNPEIISETSELGRQTAYTIKRGTGISTVVIQEFTAEGTVNITFIAMGI